MIFLKEACVENLQQAINAQKSGADRIELCANLNIDGTTPSLETIKTVKGNIQIPIHTMIRPRGGNFIYSEEELKVMKQQIKDCKELGVEGVVFGVLHKDNTLNIPVIKELILSSLPLKVVIHKAIDETPDIFESLRELETLNQNLILLTSGGTPTAEEGKKVLKKLVENANSKIEILPAGKITNENVQKLHQFISATSYHGKQIVGKLY